MKKKAKVAPPPIKPQRPGLARWRRVRHEPGRMNKLEARFAEQLEAWRLAGEVAGWWFEPLRIRLTELDWKTTYTPDFMILRADGTIELADVKGHWEDDAKVKIKVLADRMPCFHVAGYSLVGHREWQREEF